MWEELGRWKGYIYFIIIIFFKGKFWFQKDNLVILKAPPRKISRFLSSGNYMGTLEEKLLTPWVGSLIHWGISQVQWLGICLAVPESPQQLLSLLIAN